jgi:hypothetical protein
MKNVIQLPFALGLALGLQVPAFAGDKAVAPAPAEPSNPGDWCKWLQEEAGVIYKNDENPWLQFLHVGGRFMYQVASVDGEDVNGRDFNDTYDDYRRVRLESKSKFLRFFSSKIGINLVDDGRPFGDPLEWGYDTFDEAYVSFDIKKAFGAGALDGLKLSYGRFKFNMTEEVHQSSKENLTPERSAIANKLYGANNRATGATLEGTLGDWTATFGIFTGEDDADFLGGWNDGQVYYLSTSYQASDELKFVLDMMKNDPSGFDDFAGYDWAAAFNTVYEKDRFGLLATLVAGENNSTTVNRGGSFHAMMVMPSYYLVEKRLQAVVQYQYAGASESEGIRTNSRYLRAEHSPGVDVNGGRGDELHTLYAGLNYYLCGHNAKFMGGVELASLDTPKGDVTTQTFILAFRTFF